MDYYFLIGNVVRSSLELSQLFKYKKIAEFVEHRNHHIIKETKP